MPATIFAGKARSNNRGQGPLLQIFQLVQSCKRLARRHRVGVKCIDSVAQRVFVGDFHNTQVQLTLWAVRVHNLLRFKSLQVGSRSVDNMLWHTGKRRDLQTVTLVCRTRFDGVQKIGRAHV